MASIGAHRGKLFFDFKYKGVRCKEYTKLKDTVQNRKRMETLLKKIVAEIELGLFDYAATFPNSRRAQTLAVAVEPTPPAEMTPVAAALEVPPPVKPVTPTLNEFFTLWFAEKTVEWKRSYRQKIADGYALYLKEPFGNRPVGELTKAELLQLRVSLAQVNRGAAGTLSAARINQVMSLIKQILDEAADRYDFTTPYRKIKPLRMKRSEVDPFSLEEIEQLLAHLPSDFWRAYFIVRFFTGLRTGEVDGLQWEHLDWERRQIRVRQAVVLRQVDSTKNSSSEREVQMSDWVYHTLRVLQPSFRTPP